MTENKELFHKCRNFLIDAFEKNPSYSFNDASIMIDHSIHVQQIAINISDNLDCNYDVIFLGSIFHDIGKTKMINGKPAAPELLREKHESFNYEVIENFLKENHVDETTITKVERTFIDKSEELESLIIKDADIIEFYMNRRLQEALKIWGDNNGMPHELQRKADKFETVLHYEVSKQMAKPYLTIMKRFWKLQ